MTTAHKLIDSQAQLEQERRLVSFDSYDLSVRQLLDMFESGDIFVPPEYQRQFIWEADRQSVLIESVYLGIPVPSLFMATNPDSTWEVVDGVQRLGTLSHFVGGQALLAKIARKDVLTIKSLEKLDSMNGLTFSSLPKSLQLHFMTRPVRVTVLNDKSDLSIRFDLFERLNTGGVLLTAQEIRNCVYRGRFNEDVKELAQYPAFRNSIKIKEAQNKASSYEEMVLRFFAYLDNYGSFAHSVKGFLNDYMSVHQNERITREKIELFKTVFDTLRAALPDGIVRSRSTTPANLYEAVAVGTALAIKNGTTIDPSKVLPLLSDSLIKRFTGAGSNQKKYVIGRIERARDLLS